MTGENIFIGLAQIGLGFAGFSGLISMFRQAGQPWLPQDIAGIKLLLQQTFGMLLFSILPFLLFYLLGSENWVWPISSLLLAGFLGAEIAIQNLRVIQLTNEETPPRYPKLLCYGFFLPTGVFCVMELGNIWLCSFSVYRFGLVWLLIPGIIQFWIFISIPLKKQNT